MAPLTVARMAPLFEFSDSPFTVLTTDVVVEKFKVLPVVHQPCDSESDAREKK